MPQIQADLSERIRTLEKELHSALAEKATAFRYRWDQGKARFEQEALAEHRKVKRWLPSYIAHSRWLVVITAPLLYLGIIPFLLLDLFLVFYQSVCFPIYGIPKVSRSDYLVFDRERLKYLNLLERINCKYCSYANGLSSWLTEIAARTEQHWCPIKHSSRMRAPHSRYGRFFDYGDAQQYSRNIETLRNDFADLRATAPAPPDTSGK